MRSTFFTVSGACPRATMSGKRHLALDQAIEDVVEHVVRRQRVLIALAGLELGGRRLGQHILRNDGAFRSETALRPLPIAVARQRIDLGLVEVLDRIEAAIHIAIERGIADRDFRFVAGGQHHRPELVGDGHEQSTARARLQILLGRVGGGAGECLGQVFAQSLHRGVDWHDVVADAERLGGRGRVVQTLIAGVLVREHDAMDAFGPERIDRHRRAERRVDSARQPEHDSGKAVLIDIVA